MFGIKKTDPSFLQMNPMQTGSLHRPDILQVTFQAGVIPGRIDLLL